MHVGKPQSCICCVCSPLCIYYYIHITIMHSVNPLIQECSYWQRKGCVSPSRQVSPALVQRKPCPSHCLPAAHPEQTSMPRGGELQGYVSSHQTLEGEVMPHMYSSCQPLHAESCRQEGRRLAPSQPRSGALRSANHSKAYKAGSWVWMHLWNIILGHLPMFWLWQRLWSQSSWPEFISNSHHKFCTGWYMCL